MLATASAITVFVSFNKRKNDNDVRYAGNMFIFSSYMESTIIIVMPGLRRQWVGVVAAGRLVHQLQLGDRR